MENKVHNRQCTIPAMLMFPLLILTSLVHYGECTISQPSSVKFYIHDTLLSGNTEADTTTLVAAPHSKVEALVPDNLHFGDLVVFDDPLTREPSEASEKVGFAQGFYVYTGKKDLGAFWSFTAFLDTPQHKGSLTFTGAELILETSRQLAVVFGSGDFHMARGFASLNTTKFVGTTFFTLSFDVTLLYY